MSAFKKIVFFIFTILFVLSFAGTKADSSIKPELREFGSDSLYELLKSIMSELDVESQVNEKTQLLRSKDELKNQKKKTAQENLEPISYSQSNLASLQGDDGLCYKEKVWKQCALSDDLENGKGIVIYGEQVGKAPARDAELENAHGWLPDWLIAYLIRTQTFLQKNWSKQGNAAMKSVIKKILEKKTQAGKWAEPHYETIKTHWNKHVNPAVKSAKKKMEGTSKKLIDLIELLAKDKFVFTQNWHEKDDVPTFDPYSVEECMDALEMIADLDDNCFFMALEKFIDADWRKMFIKMPSSRRKKWLESLV